MTHPNSLQWPLAAMDAPIATDAKAWLCLQP